MSIKSKKAAIGSANRGTQFGHTNTLRGKLTLEEWGWIMVACGFPRTSQVIAEGLATIDNESEGNSEAGKGTAHVGAWQESADFGPEADRLDPIKSTQLAYKYWKRDGETFRNTWTQWEVSRPGAPGAPGWEQYQSIAQKIAVQLHPGTSITSVIPGPIKQALETSGIPVSAGEAVAGAVTGGVSSVVGGIESAEDFLTELAKTLLDFRSLGQLAAEAFSWFLRLILKAIWDYVIAPVFHWTERATVWYWENFFETGTERGSGVGYQLRQNGGIITISFWALGAGILWSDKPIGISPVAPQNTPLGRTIKGIEGKFARRNLTPPSKVKEKTPKKPKPKEATVAIERVGTYSVTRNRPVKVSGSGVEGGSNDGGSRGHGVTPAQQAEQTIRPRQAPARPSPQSVAQTAGEGGARMASQSHSRRRTERHAKPSRA